MNENRSKNFGHKKSIMLHFFYSILVLAFYYQHFTAEVWNIAKF